MEDLNKTQIILLTILIAFVVSIATGIMTTALLNQAPVQLTKTVDQVVEKTIQTVTSPLAPTNTSTATSSTKEVETIVVNEDDSVTSAIAQNVPSIVRIHGVSTDGKTDNLYGLGIVISSSGIIVADSQPISTVMNYSAVMSDGTAIPLVALPTPKGSQVGFFEAKPTSPYTFTSAHLSINSLQLGQTVISLGGDTTNSVEVGRVSSLNTETLPALGTSTPVQYVASVVTDVEPTDDVPGAPIISLSGDIVGMSLSSFSSPKIYIPSALIQQAINELNVAQ